MASLLYAGFIHYSKILEETLISVEKLRLLSEEERVVLCEPCDLDHLRLQKLWVSLKIRENRFFINDAIYPTQDLYTILKFSEKHHPLPGGRESGPLVLLPFDWICSYLLNLLTRRQVTLLILNRNIR
ncbi:hypothetical protein V1478_007662 [Vespula squamosa]|uniref:Uncharacterized protein n=1 Tax=Vespula squamosa TaxID=30214 RepID=A0ABD2B063_VESSQ